MNKKIKIVTPAQVRNKTIISFLLLFLFFGFCVGAWIWLQRQPEEQGALKPLRKAMNTNESLFSGMFSNYNLAKIYPKEIGKKEAPPFVLL